MALVLFAGTAGARAEQVLSLYNWPNYLPPALLQRFEAETGIRVRLDIYDTNEKMLERIRAEGHGYDLVVPSDYAVATMIEEGLAEPMDAAGLENFANVASPHDAPAYDPERTYSAPYLWGTVGFSYDPVAIGEARTSRQLVAAVRPARGAQRQARNARRRGRGLQRRGALPGA